ncbi:hypothetical protein HHI36_008262 [Cryptolaemus montrouzieri]|uniref:Uncharacterized protein n=1 Tax=Cryptolaemus montrouzieri TaxID=559131 RepID=A0ABD2MS86_9CUCU
MIGKCKSKKVILENIMSKLNNMEESYKSLMTEFDCLVEENKVLKSKLRVVKNDLEVMRKKTDIEPNKIFSEINDRMSRAKNVLLFNVKESNHLDIQQRIGLDMKKVLEIIFPANVTPDEIVKVLRLGEKSNMLY